MMPFPPATATTRLLSLADRHGALLVDFDFYPEQDLLHVTWHGHLTAEALVRGARAGLHLFAGRALPHRLLSNHLLVTGDWGEALPWLHYEWLPEVRARGVRIMAHVLARKSASQLPNFPGGPDFVAAVTQELRGRSFRSLEAGWRWLVHY